MALDPLLLEVLACPVDKGPLYYLEDDGVLYNPRRRLRYRIDDGIPVMLVEEAVEVDEEEHRRLVARAAVDGVVSGSGSSSVPDETLGRPSVGAADSAFGRDLGEPGGGP
jgi:uncharacterized protein YbaR (Trm112 family)